MMVNLCLILVVVTLVSAVCYLTEVPDEKEHLIERYGAPTCTKESRGEEYCSGGYIIILVEAVDKLVAVEHFRALDDTNEDLYVRMKSRSTS